LRSSPAKPNTGTFNTYVGSLNTAGLIGSPASGRVALTEERAKLANRPDAQPTAAELHERVGEIRSRPQRRLLEPLLRGYPDSVSRQALAEFAGYQPNTGTFNTYLGSLNSLEIVERTGPGEVRAAQWPFP
jgi:hypothetical protein